MKQINLNQNYVAIVDDEDYERVSALKWYVDKRKNRVYVKAFLWIEGKLKSIYLHRFIMDIKDPKIKVDHVNGDSLNNTTKNLRIASHKQNSRGKHVLHSNNKTGYRGVFFNKDCPSKPWMVSSSFNGKSVYVGSFKTSKEAALAFDAYAKENYKDFCGKLNFEKDLNE